MPDAAFVRRLITRDDSFEIDANQTFTINIEGVPVVFEIIEMDHEQRRSIRLKTPNKIYLFAEKNVHSGGPPSGGPSGREGYLYSHLLSRLDASPLPIPKTTIVTCMSNIEEVRRDAPKIIETKNAATEQFGHNPKFVFLVTDPASPHEVNAVRNELGPSNEVIVIGMSE